MQKSKILIVDDNEDVLIALNFLLKDKVEAVKVATNPERVEHFMKTFEPDVILLDMNFTRDAISGQEGMACLEQILRLDNEAIVVFMTAYSDTEKVVRAIKAGATDFISKPWENEKILATIKSAAELRHSRREIKSLKEKIAMLSQSLGEETPNLIGDSPAMEKVRNMIERVAETDANVLILGENGTGKDVVARMIRVLSKRNENPFIPIDLGSVPEQLFESELFGYEKGAFTGATAPKAGRMEVASGGTLFLDEIGNLSLASQAKLLMALERREITRVGSTKTKKIDVRLICATNAKIMQMVAEGNFRQDLLYRINTVEINIPPLRERGEDVLQLADFFLAKFAKKYNKQIRGIGRDAKLMLMKYDWPGNVRELQHAVERAVIMSDSSVLKPYNFMLQSAMQAAQQPNTEGLPLNLDILERDAIERAMKRADGNISYAAELLGITRYTLYRKLNK